MNYRWWLTKKKNASWPKLPSIVGKECVCLLYFENEKKQKAKETTNNKKQLKLHLNKTFKNCFLFPCCFFFINSFLFFWIYFTFFLYKKFLFSYFVKEKICILCMETDRHFCANLNTLVCVCVCTKRAPGPAQTIHRSATIMQTCIRLFLSFAKISPRQSNNNKTAEVTKTKRSLLLEQRVARKIIAMFLQSLSCSHSCAFCNECCIRLSKWERDDPP